MDARNEAAGNISTFEPSSDLIQEEDCNTLLLYLPGFTKDQLRVQLTRTRVLKISGARPLGNDKTSCFQKDFPVPENCDTGKITAKFEDGILYVRQPKTIQTQAPPKIDPPTPIRTTDDQIKQAPPPPIISPKPPLPATQLGEHNKKKPAEEDKKKQPPPVDKTAKEEDKKKQPEEKEDMKKKPAEDKTARSGADKAAGSSAAAAAAVAKVEADYSRLSPAARLKAVKDKMTNIVLLLFVFALGIYVSKLPWFSNRAHH